MAPIPIAFIVFLRPSYIGSLYMSFAPRPVVRSAVTPFYCYAVQNDLRLFAAFAACKKTTKPNGKYFLGKTK